MHKNKPLIVKKALRSFIFSSSCFLVFFGVLSCSKSAQIISNDASAGQKLEEFFWACERDLFSAAQEISSQSLIKNLTHLNKMATGGSHYYPLERDSISSMINSMSAHQYSECLIINKTGTIIYTMFADDLLGKKVSEFPLSPLPQLFAVSSKGDADVSETTIFPASEQKKEIFLVVPITEKSEVIGVIVAAVKASDLCARIPSGAFLVNREGVIQSDCDNARILTQVQIPDLSAGEDKPMMTGGKRYYPFTFRTLHWLVVVPGK